MCWAVVGIAAAAAIAAATLGAFAGLMIPLVVAAVMGTLLHPLVDRLERVGLPRSVGSGSVLVGLAVIIVVSVWVTVVGVLDQSDQISQQVTERTRVPRPGSRWAVGSHGRGRRRVRSARRRASRFVRGAVHVVRFVVLEPGCIRGGHGYRRVLPVLRVARLATADELAWWAPRRRRRLGEPVRCRRHRRDSVDISARSRCRASSPPS